MYPLTPLVRGEVLTRNRIKGILTIVADKLSDDQFEWSGGFGRQASRWLLSVAEQIEPKKVITDEQFGAILLANAYLHNWYACQNDLDEAEE